MLLMPVGFGVCSKEDGLKELDEEELNPPAVHAGDYASDVCLAGAPKKRDMNKACEHFSVAWDMTRHDLEDVCGGECPTLISPEHEFFDEYKIVSLRTDGELFRLEEGLARLTSRCPRRREVVRGRTSFDTGLLRDFDEASRLQRLAEVKESTLHYEETGDGAALARILEVSEAPDVAIFMKESKARRTMDLFKRAEAEKMSIMALLRREQAARDAKRERRRKKRKREQKRAAGL